MVNIITIKNINNSSIVLSLEHEEFLMDKNTQNTVSRIIDNNEIIAITLEETSCDWKNRYKLINTLDEIMKSLGAKFEKDTRDYNFERYVSITLFYVKSEEQILKKDDGINNNLTTTVSFITCVNNESMYLKCLEYINNLNVPQGFNVEIIPIRNVHSITSGYNRGMKKAMGKYKVYLHQDVFILNKNLISDMINIFNKDNSIGLIGVIGGKRRATNGMWVHGGQLFGTAEDNVDGKKITHRFNQPLRNYEEVYLVDGILMITQHDIWWREDIFDGWHCYDSSQCTEMKQGGKKVVIPRQYKPWVYHNNQGGHAPGYTQDKRTYSLVYRWAQNNTVGNFSRKN